MAWYLFYQSEFGNSDWKLALETQRKDLESNGKAMLTTALAVDNDFSNEKVKPEEVSYKGDLYFDFDAPDIRDTLDDVKAFITRLRDEFGVSPNSLRIYASGKKGFHIFVPAETYIEKPAAQGYKYLPAIYKEVYFRLATDTMDFRVYTARRGRMFRVANIQRPDNGKYKVPLSADEVMTLTPGEYDELVSQPRRTAGWDEPRYSPGFALLWTQAKDKIERALKDAKGKKRDAGLLKKFNGDVPPTVAALLRGEGLKEDAGFHAIALQLAITAHALGWSEDKLLEVSEGLCENHVSDGDRYNTAKKRKRELSRMWHVIDGSPGYDWSAGAIKSLVDHEAPDLSTIAPTDLNEEGEATLSLTLGITFDRSGVYALNEEGERVLKCEYGFENLRQLVSLKDLTTKGYSVDLWIGPDRKGPRMVPNKSFTSKACWNAMCLDFGGSSTQLTDPQVAALSVVFRRTLKQSEGEENVTYIVNHEGLDFVTLPDGTRDYVWLSRRGVESRGNYSYAFQHAYSKSTLMNFGTDLLEAPTLLVHGQEENSICLTRDQMEEAKQVFWHLFRVNKKQEVAKLLGWFSATFLCPIIRDQLGSFPILHIFAPAGSGKSETTKLFSNLWYWQANPTIFSANSATKYGLQEAVVSSTSVPVVLDEYKPHTMMVNKVNDLRDIIRNTYDGNSVVKGKVDRDGGASELITVSVAQTAPLAFIAESMETQVAIVERSVIVSLNKEGRDRGTPHFRAIVHGQKQHYLGSLGKALATVVLKRMEAEQVRQWILEYEAMISENPRAAETPNRTIRGRAVVAAGLRFLRAVLHRSFLEEFDEEINEMIETIVNPSGLFAPIIQSEIIQVLSTIAFLSHSGDLGTKVLYEIDYEYVEGGIDINSMKVYGKYAKYCKSVGEPCLFPSYAAFQRALDAMPGCVQSPDPSRAISPNGRNVYRIDANYLFEEEDVEPFATQ